MAPAPGLDVAPAPGRRRPAAGSFAVHALIVALLVGGAWWLLSLALAQLHARGIKSGFAFLWEPAGFDIGVQPIRFDPSDTYARAFLVGVINTLLLSLAAGIGGTALGFAGGILRLSRSLLMARLVAVAIDLVRSCPLLLQIFFWYFAVLGALPSARASLSIGGIAFLNNRGLFLPAPVIAGPEFWSAIVAFAFGAVATWLALSRLQVRISTAARLLGAMLTGIAAAALLVLATGARGHLEVPRLQGFNYVGGLNLVPEFLALWLAISIYASAFIAEIVRAGLQSVGAGQREAARALGLSPGLALRLVSLPIAMRAIIPSLTNEYLTIVKYSSLAAAIGYPDLMQIFGKTALNHTGQAIEVLTLTAGVYLALSLVTAGLMSLFNRKMAIRADRV